MRAVLVLIAIVLILSLVGWISFHQITRRAKRDD